MQTFGKLCFAIFWQHFFLNSLQFLKNYFVKQKSLQLDAKNKYAHSLNPGVAPV